MKINFNYILNYLKKHKFILLLVFILIIILLNIKPLREGLTVSSIGEYDYLAPLTQAEKDAVDVKQTPSIQSTWDSFAKKWNSVNNLTEDKRDYFPVPFPQDRQQGFINLFQMTKPELDYYIQNGEWPWDGFVTKFLKETNNVTLPQNNGNPPTSKTFTNRAIFGYYILPSVEKKTPNALAVKIFKGTAQPPTNTSNGSSSTTSSPLSSSFSPSSSSSSSSSDSNYQDFISLCKKVVGKN
jgi:hypothetical protein